MWTHTVAGRAPRGDWSLIFGSGDENHYVGYTGDDLGDRERVGALGEVEGKEIRLASRGLRGPNGRGTPETRTKGQDLIRGVPE